MPPFPAKATRRVISSNNRIPNPDGRKLRRFERQFADDLNRTFVNRRRALFAGVTETTAESQVIARVNDPAFWQPVADTLVKWLQFIAADGVVLGAEQTEMLAGVRVKADTDIMFDWTLANNEAAEWAIRWGNEVTGAMAKTTNARIQTEIANWIRNKESLNALILRVQQDPLLYSYARARRIAVTEVTRAYAHGNREAWKNSGGLITEMRWRTAVDERVCPICRPMEDVVTRVIGGEFEHPGGKDKAARWKGSRWAEPPAHQLCRCWIVPVAREVQIDTDAFLEAVRQ